MKDLKNKLSLEFEMKDLGSANKILLVQIRIDRRQRRLLSQGDNFQKLLDRFGMTDYKSVKVPLAPHLSVQAMMDLKVKRSSWIKFPMLLL